MRRLHVAQFGRVHAMWFSGGWSDATPDSRFHFRIGATIYRPIWALGPLMIARLS